MKYFKLTILPILIAGIWINIFETIRWEIIIKSLWIEYYQSLNLVFPTEPLNNIVWVVWGFLHAAIIFVLSKKYTLLQTTFLAWFAIFVLTWIVLWNINILPVQILWYNVPLSLLEVFIAAFICIKMTNK